MGGGGANLGIDRFIGGHEGDTMHFKVMGGGLAPAATTHFPPCSYAYGLYILTGKVRNIICFIGHRNSTI